MTKTPGVTYDPSLHDLLVDFEAVQPHPQNPNNGDEDAVRESMTRNGVYRPIYAQKPKRKGQAGYIVAGHTSYGVQVQMQLDAGVQRPVVPVMFLQISDETAKRIVLADNKTAADARMDDALLYDLLLDLDGDLTGTGYDDDDLERLQRHLDNMGLDAEGELASDLSDALDITEDQMVVSVVIDKARRADFYAHMSEIPYVHDTRDAAR